MHRLLFVSFVLIFALPACGSPAPTPLPARSDYSAPSPAATARPARLIQLVAQRGAAGLAAEDTLTAFRIGINYNPDFLEMDVHLTRDGIPIVMHDPTIDRTTEGKGRLADMTLAELGRFSTHSTSQSYREPIPTLAQVLDLAKSKNVRVDVQIMVDADGKRYPGIERKVLDELAARDMLDRARILALEFETLQQVRTIRPTAKTNALLSGDYFRRMGNRDNTVIVDEVASFADGIGVDKGFLSAELIDAAHRRKLSAGVWTVDTEEAMEQFARMGVDSITTNRPDVFNKVFGR